MIHERHMCADPECITDAFERVEKELRDGERLWLIEQSKEGRWTASAVIERQTDPNDHYLGITETQLVNVGYGSGNTMYQALSQLRTNIKLRHLQQDEKGRA